MKFIIFPRISLHAASLIFSLARLLHCEMVKADENIRILQSGLASGNADYVYKALNELSVRAKTNVMCRRLLVESIWSDNVEVCGGAARIVGPMTNELLAIALDKMAASGFSSVFQAQFFLSGRGANSWLGSTRHPMDHSKFVFRVRLYSGESILVNVDDAIASISERLTTRNPATVDFWIMYSLNYEQRRPLLQPDMDVLLQMLDANWADFSGLNIAILIKNRGSNWVNKIGEVL
jgi:hypothetical protein